jgi:shikimate dehydrogenase
MMYGKGDTPFMVFARQQGAAQVADGLGMLVEQAAEAFFVWRGIRPDSAPVMALLRGT